MKLRTILEENSFPLIRNVTIDYDIALYKDRFYNRISPVESAISPRPERFGGAIVTYLVEREVDLTYADDDGRSPSVF